MAKTIAIHNAGDVPGVAIKSADDLCIAAITPFTTIDFPGLLSAVVFIQGCPWRCPYCQNAWMQSRERVSGAEIITWDSVRTLLKKRRGLLDGVVFSGGEPCIDSALPSAMEEVKALGMKVGLHTSGAYPRHLKEVLPLLDWVGLDVKGPPENPEVFNRAAGRDNAHLSFLESFEALKEARVSYEARTTAHPELLSSDDILSAALWLKKNGCTTYALQIYRAPPGVKPTLAAVGSDYPGEEHVSQLKALFPSFTLRRG